MTSGILLIVLGLVLAGVALGFAWQGRRGEGEDIAVYSVEDSIRFVTERLTPATAETIKRSDVRRILEWEVRYLQDPGLRGDDDPVVAGGLPSAEFAQESLALLGHAYDGPEIIEVLDLRSGYLREIGAIGEPLTAAEVSDIDPSDRPSAHSNGGIS
jgi:hypothetical protein